MKTIKRIFAVVLLIVTVALVGYLVYTGSRLPTLDDVGGADAALSNL